MSVCLIANVKVHDDAWIPEYAQKVQHIVHKHGGKYLSRIGKPMPIEGELPEYTPFAKARQADTDSHFYAPADTDLAQGLPACRPASG